MNPLLSRDFEVPFDQVEPEHVLPGVEEAVRQAQAQLEQVMDAAGQRNYDNTVDAVDELAERVERAVSIAAHLMAVANEPELRKAFDSVVPVFSEFFARLSSDGRLYAVLQEYAASSDAQGLDPVRSRRLEKLLDELRRAGAGLDDEQRGRLLEIRTELARLGTGFSNNLLDATNAFEMVLTAEDEVAGLPESALSQARASARAKGTDGWRFTLQAPSYQAFMQFAERRDLRQKLHAAYSHRASSGEHDNGPLIRRILELRREMAQLLGYRDFADYRTEINMIGSGTAAVQFERELFEETLPYYRQEMAELEEFAARHLGIDRLEPWDEAFAVEKLRKDRFDLESEELRPYFPLPQVLTGLWEIARRLYGVGVSEAGNNRVWHPDVRFFEVREEESGRHIGSFYADFHPRETKRSGAWMNGLIHGEPDMSGALSPHLGMIVTNFTPPQGEKPALLTHREVQTLFHEFGHMLHHPLSRVELPALSGTNVPRDWVELPSHFMENWTWHEDALALFAAHFETGEQIPRSLLEKLQASRNFMEARAQMRQLSFGTIDLALHVDYDPQSGEDPVEFGNRVRERFVLRPDHAHDAFLCGFAHIFSGGYASGYYSYKWSEMLEADAFTRFEANGIFDRATGQRFVDAILSRGDSLDQMQQFEDFMGREPDLGALLRRNLGEAHVSGEASGASD